MAKPFSYAYNQSSERISAVSVVICPTGNSV